MLEKIFHYLGFHIYRYDYLKYIKDCVITCDSDGNVIEVNKAALDLFGYKKNYFEQMNASSLFANETQFLTVNKELNKNGLFSGQIVNLKSDGSRFISFLSCYVIRDKKGLITGSIGISRDVTQKVSDRNILDTIVHNSNEIIYLTNLNGAIKFINRKGVEELGYEKEEIIGRNLRDFVPNKYHKDLAALFMTQFSKDSNLPVIQFEMLRKDSTTFRIEQRLHSISNTINPSFKSGFQGSLRKI